MRALWVGVAAAGTLQLIAGSLLAWVLLDLKQVMTETPWLFAGATAANLAGSLVLLAVFARVCFLPATAKPATP